MSDPIREAQARAAEFNAQAKAGANVTQYASDPTRITLRELVDAIEGMEDGKPWDYHLRKARLTLALNAARNALKVGT